MTLETELEPEEQEEIEGTDIATMLQELADWAGGMYDPDMPMPLITSENAADFGIELDEGYSIRLDSWGYRKWNATMITPEGWQYTNAGGVVSPEGETSTWDEIESYQREAQGLADYEPTWNAVLQQMQQQIGYIDVGYLRLQLDKPAHVELLMEKYPDEFIESMRQIGHTPEVDALLKAWNWEESDIKDLFGEYRPWVLPSWIPFVGGTNWPKGLQTMVGGEAGQGGLMGAINWVSAPWETLQSATTCLMHYQKSLELGSQTATEFKQAIDSSLWNPLIIFDDHFQELSEAYSQEMISPFWRTYWEFVNPVWYVSAGSGLGIAATVTSKIPLVGKSLQGAAVAMKMAESAPGWVIGKSLKFFVNKGIRIPEATIKKTLSTTKLFEHPDNFTPIGQRVDKLLTDNWQRRIIQSIADAPITGKVTRPITEKVLGTNILVKKASSEVQDIVGKGAVGYGSICKAGQNVAHLQSQILQGVERNPMKLFGFDERAFSQKMVGRLKPGFKSEANAGTLEHVFTNHSKYNWKGLEKGQEYIVKFNDVMDDTLEFLKKQGAEPEHLLDDYIHRVVVGRYTPEGEFIPTKRMGKRLYRGSFGRKPAYEMHRRAETMMEGIEWGVIYNNDPLVSLTSYIEEAYIHVADKQFVNYVSKELARVGKQGMTPKEMLARDFPHLVESVTTEKGRQLVTLSVLKAEELSEAKGFVSVLNRAIRGEKIPEQTIGATERRFPEEGMKLRELLDLRGRTGQNVNADLQSLKQDLRNTVAARRLSYQEAKTEVSFRMEQARQAGIGKGYIMQSAFGGKIYEQDFIDAFNKFFGHQPGSKILSVISDAAGILRITKAALDLSAPAIQGMPSWGLAHSLLVTNPKMGVKLVGAWYRGFAYNIGAFLDPSLIGNYLSKHETSAMQRIACGGSTASIDYFATLGAKRGLGGLAAKAMTKIPLQPFQRAEASFFGFSEVVRDEFWKILSPKAFKTGKEFELARFLDRITGITDAASMGVPLTTRQIEQSFIWFAPNYTRACLTVVADIFRGGYTGAQARRAIGGMVGAGALMYAGTQYSIATLSGKSHEDAFNDVLAGFGLAQDPITGDWEWKPRARFMTLEVANYNYGIGGFWYGLLRLFGNVNATLDNDIVDFVKIIKDGEINKDNPFVYWWFTRASPFTGTGYELYTGRDFLGYPIETPNEYIKYIATRFEPIWMEQGLNWMIPTMANQYEIPEGEAKVTTPIAEIFGLRTFPESAWVIFNDKVNEILPTLPDEFYDKYYTEDELTGILEARDSGKLKWEHLNELAQLALRMMHPEINKLYDEASADSALRSSDLWKQWESRLDEEKAVYYNRGDNLIQRLLSGDIDTTQLRESWSESGQNYGVALDTIAKEDTYDTIYNYLQSRGEDAGGEYDWGVQLALDEYQRVMFDDYTNEYGDMDWDARDEAVQGFIKDYGQDTYDLIREHYANEKLIEGMNPLLVQLWNDKELIGREYWNIPYDYETGEGAEERLNYRISHPEVDAKLAIWGYGGRLQTMDAYNIVQSWGKETGVPLSQMGLGLPPENIIEDYFGYSEILRDFSGNSAEARLYRLENPDWNEWGQGNYGWDMIEAPVQSLRISAQWRDLDEQYADVTGSSEEKKEQRLAILGANPEYARARRERDAWDVGFGENLIGDYIDWYNSDWAHKYEDDWFLMEHPEFYQEMLKLEIFTDPRDFNKVVTRDEYPLYVDYYNLPTSGNSREWFRWDNPELDACLVRIGAASKPITKWWSPPWIED